MKTYRKFSGEKKHMLTESQIMKIVHESVIRLLNEDDEINFYGIYADDEYDVFVAEPICRLTDKNFVTDANGDTEIIVNGEDITIPYEFKNFDGEPEPGDYIFDAAGGSCCCYRIDGEFGPVGVDTTMGSFLIGTKQDLIGWATKYAHEENLDSAKMIAAINRA